MAKDLAKRPAEILGYPIGNQSDAAQDARQKHWCPFQENQCDSRRKDFHANTLPYSRCTT